LLAPDKPDQIDAGFSIFEFLVIARRHKPDSKPGGGFSQAFWQRLQKDPRLAHIHIYVAKLRAASGRGRYAFNVTTATGLLQLLPIIQAYLPKAKEPSQPPPPTEHNHALAGMDIRAVFADPVLKAQFEILWERHHNPNKQKINADLIATVTDTLQRFIAGDRSMLRVIESVSETISEHNQINCIPESVSEHISQRDVYFRCHGQYIMGTYHADMDKPVFSVYMFINISRNEDSNADRKYYTRHVWDLAKKQKLECVSYSVMAKIRVNRMTRLSTMTPALPMDQLYPLLSFMDSYASVRAKKSSEGRPLTGMRKNKLYEPFPKEIYDKVDRLLLAYEKGDRAMIKYIE
jgi:hypothetical protein